MTHEFCDPASDRSRGGLDGTRAQSKVQGRKGGTGFGGARGTGPVRTLLLMGRDTNGTGLDGTEWLGCAGGEPDEEGSAGWGSVFTKRGLVRAVLRKYNVSSNLRRATSCGLPGCPGVFQGCCVRSTCEARRDPGSLISVMRFREWKSLENSAPGARSAATRKTNDFR
jgi:hypothetical protein